MADQEEKERLIIGARDRFFASGFSKVTVDEISSDLGMSKKTVYKFFPSKDDLLKGVIDFMLARVGRQIDEVIASNKPFEQKLAQILAIAGQVTKRISPAFMDDVRRNLPGVWRHIEEFRRVHIFEKVKTLMQQAKAEGVLRQEVNVELFFLVFFHAVQGILNPNSLLQLPVSPDEAIRSIFRILFLGAMESTAEDRYHAVEEILNQQSSQRSL
ncbi:MAG: TetR/AcrR family transcriptional regulator [Bacteroidetes bacterium]|jgi:AcrR family transcriptional regulator|nr:TetR/AcrR family transcriptional regulator [Bacteroidota bacterium]MCU0452565.1 TetR/AcrR family transcriptional regulator [Bacteroidota bacterium]